MLNTNYHFYATHTTLDVLNMRIVYVLPENISVLRDEIYDHAFVLFKPNTKQVVDWRKIKNEPRKNIHLSTVRRPSSYINGCAILVPSTFKVDRDELLVRIDDHVARLFTYTVEGERFVPNHLKESLLTAEEDQEVCDRVRQQPFIDISTLPCPCSNKTVQIPLL